MLTVTVQDLRKLSEATRTFDFIVVGEMHGLKQNAPLIQDLLGMLLAKKNLITMAFEWVLTKLELEALRTYIHNGKVPEKLPTFFLDSDGRFTYEHILLLKWIRESNIRSGNSINIFTFDNDKSTGDQERVMADSLCVYKKNKPDTVLVETGNMHAKKSSYMRASASYTTMASFLNENYKVFSIFLHYLHGKIEVDGEIRDIADAMSQKENFSAYFDAVIKIPVGEPSRQLLDLTEVVSML